MLFIVNSTKSFVKPVVTTVIYDTSFTTKVVSVSMVSKFRNDKVVNAQLAKPTSCVHVMMSLIVRH